ncbi:MAG: SDR family NAD(P)-dependent oxidoreductase [Pseudomonadota bacterium]
MAKTILITGANRGIGRELAVQAVARGDDVTGTARAAATDHDAPCPLVSVDVTDPETLAVLSDGPPIDLLICNAGQYLARGGLEDPSQTADAWASVLMTNVAGVFFTVRAVIGRLRSAEHAKIAVISSRMGSSDRAPGGSPLYRASKAAATNLAANLASELRGDGISVGAYHPGWVRTDMGGEHAEIGVQESAAGLLRRFDTLSIETTGVFEDYRGAAIPF